MAASNLRELLDVEERRLRLELEDARIRYQHHGIRGDGVEGALRKFLQNHLPSPFNVGTGEIVDTRDYRSGQIDIVVANQDQPFQGHIHAPQLFLVEGVAAVGEVKSVLTTQEIDKILASGAKLKNLRNQHQVGDLINTNQADRERFYESPPFFVVAFESKVSGETIAAKLQQSSNVSVDGGPALPSVDAIFVLEKGFAVNYGDGNGSLRWMPTTGPDAGRSIPGWIWFDADTVLVDMMMWLGMVMPRVIRFNSISVPYLLASVAARTGYIPPRHGG